jgi:arylsulfatase A-like enzyme
MQWKGRIPPGSKYLRPVISLDLMPTFIAAAGRTVHPDWNLDGVDLMPFITRGKEDKTASPHDMLYWSWGARKAIRQAHLKAMSQDGGKSWQIYNIRKDISETNDLAHRMSEKLKELIAAHTKWESSLMPQQWGWNSALGYRDPEFGKPRPYHDPAWFSKTSQ